jgi:hypothetical protein
MTACQNYAMGITALWIISLPQQHLTQWHSAYYNTVIIMALANMTLGQLTLIIATVTLLNQHAGIHHNDMTFGIIALSIKTVITTLSIMINQLNYITQFNIISQLDCFILLLSIIVSAVIQSVIMLNVVAPILRCFSKKRVEP